MANVSAFERQLAPSRIGVAGRCRLNIDLTVPVSFPVAGSGLREWPFQFYYGGGAFSPEYNWYRNVDPRGFWDDRDIYNTLVAPPEKGWIINEPKYRIDCALDAKFNLLRQAQYCTRWVPLCQPQKR
ncbi:hypothetical protein MYX82_00365 [Acidobacteria bacterium AH-259-D05]|nr:hypothetical protein [Acidobacteria bacterium AH-259-D05]